MKYIFIILIFAACQQRDAPKPAMGIPAKSENLGFMGKYDNRCGDCAEGEISLQISENFTYTLEGSFKASGTYRWSADGTSLILDRPGLPDAVLRVTGRSLVFESTGDTLHKVAAQKAPAELQTIPRGRWTLIELRGKATRKIQKDDPYMNVGPNRTITAYAGCNSIGGKFTIKGSTIKFVDLIQTEMACEGADLEAPFVEALASADNFIVNGKSLQLRQGQSVTAKFEASASADAVR